jgi:hypothetical protein
MLRVINMTFTLCVIMTNVIMLSGIMLNAFKVSLCIMLYGFMLSVNYAACRVCRVS